MTTHYLQQLSFHKLDAHSPNASLHSFVLVRNSLLHSILAQQQQDSWLDACFDELTPSDDIDMLLLEEDDDEDEDDEEDEGPDSPEQVEFSPHNRSPTFFIPMDDDDDDTLGDKTMENIIGVESSNQDIGFLSRNT